MILHPTLEAIYDFFKPMKETVVWANDNEVCVHWQNATGYMRWYSDNGVVLVEWVPTR